MAFSSAPARFAPFARGLARSLLLCSAVLAAGCGTDEGDDIVPAQNAQFVQDVAERAEVLALIGTIDTAPFDEAFRDLAEHEFTRYTRTEQYDDDRDFIVAFRERTVRHEGPSHARRFTEISGDSTGAFDFGFFRRFVSANVEDEDPDNLAPHLFPEDPMYLSERNYDAYYYRFLPDTLMRQVAARVVEIRARPIEGDGKNIRRARYYFEKGSNQLIAFQLERIDLALFFREDSAFYTHIQKNPEGDWVPYNTRFETRILMPFKPPQRFRTVATYTEYGNG